MSTVVVSELKCANFQLDKGDCNRPTTHSPSGRYIYLYPKKEEAGMIVFDTWNETKIFLQPTVSSLPNFRIYYMNPCFIDDHTLVQLCRFQHSPPCDEFMLRINLEKQTYEFQLLGLRSVYEPVAVTFSIAVESDWLLFAAETVDETDRFFWFNMETKELKTFQLLDFSLAEVCYTRIFYKNQKLYAIYTEQRKIRCYDLTLHLPWLLTSDIAAVPAQEIKINGALKDVSLNTCGTSAQVDTVIVYNVKRRSLRILDFNTGQFKHFKLPLSSELLGSTVLLYLKSFFVFDGSFLTIHSKKDVCCENSENQIEMTTTRFALRKPESLFNLAWFHRPRDLQASDYMRRLL